MLISLSNFINTARFIWSITPSSIQGPCYLPPTEQQQSIFSSPSWHRFCFFPSISHITIDPNIFFFPVKASSTTFPRNPNCYNDSFLPRCSCSLCHSCSSLPESSENSCHCGCNPYCSYSICRSYSLFFCRSCSFFSFYRSCSLSGSILQLKSIYLMNCIFSYIWNLL